MGREIERKFLVDETKLPLNLEWKKYIQGYLSFEPTIRIRITPDRAFLTIKSGPAFSHDEWEYEVPMQDAKELYKLCGEYVVEKERAITIFEEKKWEIDRFHGKNEGLFTVEVELNSEDENVNMPLWVTKEVTGDPQYLNSNLARKPINQL